MLKVAAMYISVQCSNAMSGGRCKMLGDFNALITTPLMLAVSGEGGWIGEGPQPLG